MKVSALPANINAGDADKQVAENVVAYLRVSTTDQAENGLGLPIQKDQIHAYLKAHPEFTLVQTYEDAGISGAKLEERPGLQQLLADAKHRTFTKVIVAKLDRLARELFIQLWVEKELLVHEAEVISVAESFNGKDPMTTAMRQIVGVFAQLEKGRITERLLAGRKKKLESGTYAGGRPAFGYRAVGGKLEADPSTSQIVKEISRMKMGRHSYQQIADKLNQRGIKPRCGKKFYASTVRYILKNSTYRGDAKYGSVVAGIHERLL